MNRIIALINASLLLGTAGLDVVSAEHNSTRSAVAPGGVGVSTSETGSIVGFGFASDPDESPEAIGGANFNVSNIDPNFSIAEGTVEVTVTQVVNPA